MDRTQTYVPNQQVRSAELNAIQDRALGGGPGNANNTLSTLGDGWDVRLWMLDATELASGDLVMLDGQIDYRDRMLLVTYNAMSTSTQEPGGSNDHLLNYAPAWRIGYTGLGALGAASAAVVAGVPPVPAAGASWALQIATNLWLYADPTLHALYLYNDTGSAIRHPLLTVFASAFTGARVLP